MAKCTLVIWIHDDDDDILHFTFCLLPNLPAGQLCLTLNCQEQVLPLSRNEMELKLPWITYSWISSRIRINRVCDWVACVCVWLLLDLGIHLCSLRNSNSLGSQGRSIFSPSFKVTFDSVLRPNVTFACTYKVSINENVSFFSHPCFFYAKSMWLNATGFYFIFRLTNVTCYM